MKFDDKVGYLLPFLTHDLNKWLKKHPGTTEAELARKAGISRQVFHRNLEDVKYPSTKFLARYALATDRDIQEFFADVALVINLQIKGIQPYGEEPEIIMYNEMKLRPDAQVTPLKNPGKYIYAKAIVQEWQKSNPGERRVDCVRATGLSPAAIYRHWNKEIEEKTIVATTAIPIQNFSTLSAKSEY